MWKQIMNSSFCRAWGRVLSIIFSPGFLISILTTFVALGLSIFYKENVPFSTTMTILGSITGGVAGAFFKDEYDRMSGKNILEKKGRSALRNLQGISTQLCNIKSWVVDFLKKTKKQEDRSVLEEINRHISTIELSIASGLEDWVDIVPELKEKSLRGEEIDKKYQEAAQSVVLQLLESHKELAAAKDEKVEQELKKKITDLEKQVKEIKKERSETFGGVTAGTVTFGGSAMTMGSTGSYVYSLSSEVCKNCGKIFSPNRSLIMPISVGSSYCDQCRKGMGGGAITVSPYGEK